jgi:hypothetical protein
MVAILAISTFGLITLTAAEERIGFAFCMPMSNYGTPLDIETL